MHHCDTKVTKQPQHRQRDTVESLGGGDTHIGITLPESTAHSSDMDCIFELTRALHLGAMSLQLCEVGLKMGRHLAGFDCLDELQDERAPN
eukprot:4091496-Heterocapsa_arctica.AAC.1